MRIKEISIQNFRSITHLTLALDETTVLIGPNNSGKSAILESLRIALSRRWGQQGTGFTENDVHLESPETDPRTAAPIRIQLSFEEQHDGEWPDDMVSELDEIVTQTSAGLNRVSLAIIYSWNADIEAFEPSWEFLNPAGDPLSQRRRSINLSGFYNYVLFNWLGALRNADAEFASRSRHWGGLLKSMNIPPAVEQEIMKALDELDGKLLSADSRFAQIADTVGRATEVAMGNTPGAAKIRMLPLNLWDLLSRAGIVLRNEKILPWLPLDHHGQGLQSLAVIFLLQAAVSHQLATNEQQGAEPFFAIEEPEAHLHPQAARTLWRRISALPGQKIATTHSPYFVQHVPLHNIRIVRFDGRATAIASIKRRVVSSLPWTQEVENLIKGRKLRQFEMNSETGTIASQGWLDEHIAADIVGCWKGTSELAETQKRVAVFRYQCRTLVTADEENELGILGRRMRGEIFFAKRWVLVEGQCEYLLLHALGTALGYDLDQQGVAVIDFQNNGNPSIYAGLADALEIPWIMIADADPQGQAFREQLLKRGFTEDDLKKHLSTFAASNDLEDQLLADGHEQMLRDILAMISGAAAKTCPLEEFKKRLKNKKTPYMLELAPMVAADPALAAKMPAVFLQAIDKLKTGAI